MTPVQPRPSVTLSVVSHGHGAQVLDMLHSFARSGLAQTWQVDVVVTLNIPEPSLQAALHQATLLARWPFTVRTVCNPRPLGFGANHNQALHTSGAQWFCITNPDILWLKTPIQPIPMHSGASTHAGRAGQGESPADRPVGLYCPVQVSPAGQPQDYARTLPLPWVLARRTLQRLQGQTASLGIAAKPEQADWVNGACMVFAAPAYRQLGGFDTRYFMYGEDIDICLRLQLQGYAMATLPLAVVHHAQRKTARQWRHLGWHLRSLARLWTSRAFWQYFWRYARARQHRHPGASPPSRSP